MTDKPPCARCKELEDRLAWAEGLARNIENLLDRLNQLAVARAAATTALRDWNSLGSPKESEK